MTTQEPRCSGCYDSFSGPWCDNCDTWPCICVQGHITDAGYVPEDWNTSSEETP